MGTLLLLLLLTPVLVRLLFLLLLLLTPVVVCGSAASGVRCLLNIPKYPQSADGQLKKDQAFCTELQGELKTAIFGMCTNNPTVRGKPRLADTKADLIFKRVFCLYL